MGTGCEQFRENSNDLMNITLNLLNAMILDVEKMLNMLIITKTPITTAMRYNFRLPDWQDQKCYDMWSYHDYGSQAHSHIASGRVASHKHCADHFGNSIKFKNTLILFF